RPRRGEHGSGPYRAERRATRTAEQPHAGRRRAPYRSEHGRHRPLKGGAAMRMDGRTAMGRRSFLASMGTLAAAPLVGGTAIDAFAQAPASRRQPATEALGR